MADIPDIDFGEDDPFDLGRVNLSLDGTVWANLYSAEADPFIGTGKVLDLSELYAAIGYDPRDDLQIEIDDLITDYNGEALSRKRDRKYFGMTQLRAKMDGMRGIWHYIETIWIDRSGGDLLDVYIIHFDSTFNAKYVKK